MYNVQLKKDIYCRAEDMGAEIVRSCSVDSWRQEAIQSPEFWPENIWPWAKSVIVLAIPLFFPMASTALSMPYQEQYDTSNRIMDDMS